jgi:hypothetical protein
MGKQISCPVCDASDLKVKEGARGGLSMSCGKCGYQGFARTPKASEAMRAKMGAASANPAPKKPDDDDGDFLKKL